MAPPSSEEPGSKPRPRKRGSSGSGRTRPAAPKRASARRSRVPAQAPAPGVLLRTQPIIGFAPARDGTPLYYEVFGPVEGAPEAALPIVLLDGVGCDGYVWKYLAPELARDRLVVHFHYRGHGRTPLPRDPAR